MTSDIAGNGGVPAAVLAALACFALDPPSSPGQTVVTIDADGVPVVNGERTFLYGAYRDPSDIPGIFTGLNEAQFNLVHSYFFEQFPVQTETQKDAWIAQASTFLDIAESHDKGVFLGLPRGLIIDNPNSAWLAEMVSAVKDKPALFFWQLYDEPSNVTFNNSVNLMKLQDAYGTIKAADANHPVQVVDFFRLHEVDTYSDIISMELYPIRADNIVTINDDEAGLMRSLRDLASGRGQAPNSPFTTTLQGHDYRISRAISQNALDQIDIDGTTYRPNPDEIRAQAHLAIALGLYTPTYFWNDSSAYDLQSEAPEIWQAFVDLGAELNGLGEAIVSAEPVPPIGITPVLSPSQATNTPSDVDIISWSRMSDGELFVSLLNPGDWSFDNDVIDVEIDLPLDGFDSVTLFQGDMLLNRVGGTWQLDPAADGITVLDFDGQTLLVRTDYAETLVFHLTPQLIPGDFDNSGEVGLNDLNLVLFNWNVAAESIPPEWVNDRPVGTVDISNLNQVLFNWNTNTAATLSLPEPSTPMLPWVQGILAGWLLKSGHRRVARFVPSA